MTVFELFNSIGEDNISEIMFAKNMSVPEAELYCSFELTQYVSSFCTEYECHKVINWKIAYIQNNKVCLALSIEY